MAYKKLKKIVSRYLPVIEDPSDHRSGFCVNPKVGIPRIEIDTTNADDTYLFSALTHEFGHYLSWKNGHKDIKKYHKAMVISANLGFIEKLTKCQKTLVFEEERRAWERGARFVKRRGFKLDQDFYTIKKFYLERYRGILFDEVYINMTNLK